MAEITLPANGDSVEIVAAAAVRAIVQNTGSGSSDTGSPTIEVLNHASSAVDGILLGAGETLDLGKVSAWTLAWQGRSTNGKVNIVRVASE